MQLFYDSICDVGLARSINQDAIYGESGQDWGIFVVCDGMGGHLDGERASAEIVNAIESTVKNNRNDFVYKKLDEIQFMLEEAVSSANQRIRALTPGNAICGSTVVILFILKEQYLIMWAGDSRCYEADGKMFSRSFRQITMDDVVRANSNIPIQSQRDIGKLTNAVGISSEVRCNFQTNTWKSGQIFFLCTDGVYKYMDGQKLEKVLVQAVKTHGNDVLEYISQEVRRGGAKDNYSAIIVNVLD